ncbi:unnamed protein product [Ilex paraguariensis]|uniref:Uncharacterized protein n=1 Tax=Ilex paraguariensis TaxID=185542 RepID=A0ABC8S6C7_9AQUA
MPQCLVYQPTLSLSPPLEQYLNRQGLDCLNQQRFQRSEVEKTDSESQLEEDEQFARALQESLNFETPPPDMKMEAEAEMDSFFSLYLSPIQHDSGTNNAESSSPEEEGEDEDAEKGEDEKKSKTKKMKETTYEWEPWNDVKTICVRNPMEVIANDSDAHL